MHFPLTLALALSASVLGAPAPAVDSSSSVVADPTNIPSSTTDSSHPSPTVPYASGDLNESYLDKFQNELPEPVRGSKGAKILGPQNIPLDRQNPDFLASPSY
ncbi:oxalate decarboxylase [Rhizoctonia solani]|uniref:Oxalate decarboxylase n=1 Tax=Rhizoctonia solani TaxID=456999 RepID=A0A8H8P639_9AGAM|nr:oxalate decarboxylase [Rhizoctonia solani]QRW25012.1 oxalate decarboxylase [Rhizoctonia solani]